MPRKLKVFAVQVMPAGIPLKHPVMTAASNVRAAAKALKVSRYHLTRQPMPRLTQADIDRALALPGQRVVAADEVA